jgi:inorganic pyrophosphatase
MDTGQAKLAGVFGRRATRGLLNVIIDTPLGSRNKYKFDEGAGKFKLSRILPEGLHFPCDFGFIPGTAADDGDPLDVAILVDAASFVGCLMTVRLLGVIRATQMEQRRSIKNDRLLGIPVTSVNHPRARDIRDIPKDRLDALEQFFVAYNREQGRPFKLNGRQGAAAAIQAVREGFSKGNRSPRRRG